MSVPEKSVEGEEHAKLRPGTSERSVNGGRVLELSMQCPFEDMAPDGERSDLLTHVGFVDGPVKAAYVNGSGSPGIPGEVLLDISRNVPGFLPAPYPGEGDPIRKEAREFWDFSMDTAESSGAELDWDPHREFLEFLMEEPEERPSAPDARKGKRRAGTPDPSGCGRVPTGLCPDPDPDQGAPKPRYANGTKITCKPAWGPRGGREGGECGGASLDHGSLSEHAGVERRRKKRKRKDVAKKKAGHEKDERSYAGPDPPGRPQEKCRGGDRRPGRRKKKKQKEENGKAARNHARVPNRAPSEEEERPGGAGTRVRNPKRSRHPGSPGPPEKERAKTKDATRSKKMPDRPLENESDAPGPRGPSLKAPEGPGAGLPLDKAPPPPSGTRWGVLGTPAGVGPVGARSHGGPGGPESPRGNPPTPFRRLQGRDILIDFPKCREMFQQDSSLYLVDQRGQRRDSLGDAPEPRPGVPMFSIKEEWTEAKAWPEPTGPLTNGDVALTLKRCLYCPALFESGIGLSNHVRGHLHRVGVGVSYDEGPAARAPSGEKGQRRRKVHAHPRLKKELVASDDAAAPGPEPALACPLCRERFESKTGLSNHVRGHLKRLGRPCSTKTLGSPVLVLKALMRDEQHRPKLRALKASLKARGRPGRPSGAFGFESGPAADPRGGAGASPSSDLIGILKKRRAHEEARAKAQPQAARREGAPPEPPPSSGPERGKANPRVCVHCNATFYSGVALSNHLRAYLRRKQTALQEGTTYDCSKRKQRSRSGSKKKTDPSLQTPEDLYRLTCRFCDLVFQGPLSVQEDWVKHLQRHIMNTGVAHTGVAMTEVTRLPDDPDAHTQAAV